MWKPVERVFVVSEHIAGKQLKRHPIQKNTNQSVPDLG
jgi:hypothetical protein